MPDNRGRLLATLSCVLLAVAGCGSSGDADKPLGEAAAERGAVEPTTPAEIGPEPVHRVDCAGRIQAVAAPTDTYTVVLGDVAFETSRKLQATDGGGTDAPHPWFAKTGLLVRDGAAVDILVEGKDADHAAVGWGNGASGGAQSVRVPGCAGDGAETPWTVFPGGYWVDQPRCVTVTVRVRGEQTRVRVPVGADC
ncbi:hypothetical protein [Streptomyces sp. SID3343]|uniref:hypothetical protein n=1 Tax=Streptomyces sp. SID3343 TaxID=2690260 RepID=UPI00136D7301|nr:hypothetical protein [Streptomyces sp. SID3343]MYW02659.1 hypothetical protein [Streptomyces sp. SID3343]